VQEGLGKASRETKTHDEGADMTGPDPSSDGNPPERERIPFFQRLMDNHFLLLFLGVTMPTVLYLIWGIMEIIQIPLASP
jgi:hypothetical protein